MNAGFEDALRLKEILDECGHDNRHEAFQVRLCHKAAQIPTLGRA
jgi:hypothetical protein